MNYPEGSYVKHDGNRYRKVLGQAGEVRFLSMSWVQTPGERDIRNDMAEQADWTMSVQGMKRSGFLEVSPEEATGRKEQWEPEFDDWYWCPNVMMKRSDRCQFICDLYDKNIIETVGVFKTKEESDARLKRILEAIKNIE